MKQIEMESMPTAAKCANSIKLSTPFTCPLRILPRSRFALYCTSRIFFLPTLTLVLLCGTYTTSEVKLIKASFGIYPQNLQSLNLASEPVWP